eukprot:4313343-Amphidinium_carterae.1
MGSGAEVRWLSTGFPNQLPHYCYPFRPPKPTRLRFTNLLTTLAASGELEEQRETRTYIPSHSQQDALLTKP